MEQYQLFSNIDDDFISKEYFFRLIDHANKKELCKYTWEHRDILKHSIPNLFKFQTLEDFTDFWGDKFVASAKFLKEIGILEEDVFHLYRAVILGPDDVEPDLKAPGICWTVSRSLAEKFGNGLIDDLEDDPNFAVCILEADIRIEDMDLFGSLLLNVIEPAEKEVRLYPNPQLENTDYEVL